MTEILTVVLMVTGTAFALLAAIAVVRLPDIYTRMHGATKSATLGIGCTMLAAAVEFANVGTTTVATLVIGFIVLTAPVAAHMIGRAAHRARIPKWSGTVIDESPFADSVNQASDDDIPPTKPMEDNGPFDF